MRLPALLKTLLVIALTVTGTAVGLFTMCCGKAAYPIHHPPASRSWAETTAHSHVPMLDASKTSPLLCALQQNSIAIPLIDFGRSTEIVSDTMGGHLGVRQLRKAGDCSALAHTDDSGRRLCILLCSWSA